MEKFKTRCEKCQNEKEWLGKPAYNGEVGDKLRYAGYGPMHQICTCGHSYLIIIEKSDSEIDDCAGKEYVNGELVNRIRKVPVIRSFPSEKAAAYVRKKQADFSKNLIRESGQFEGYKGII